MATVHGSLLMTGRAPEVTELRALLAEAFGVPAQEVWIEDETPVPDRVAPVAAARRHAAPGDVAWLLDVSCADDVPRQPSEREFAVWLAGRLGSGVLFPAESFPPSAYWLAAPGGPVTRARVHDIDADDAEGDLIGYAIDAVGAAVPGMPQLRVIPGLTADGPV